MALLVTKDHRPIIVTAEQARLLWLVKTGERKGTPSTKAKAAQIDKWYLNRNNAPKSWLALHTHREPAPAGQQRLPYKDNA